MKGTAQKNGPGARVTLRSGCKINLALRIVGQRPDGRHDLDTLFFPLPEPFDELTLDWLADASFEETGGRAFTLECAAPDIDLERNTLTKAYDLFAGASGFSPRLRASLRKGVPSGAGLGGGSADAAALLLWLNDAAKSAGLQLPPSELAGVAAGVGADVPFFLHNTPCHAAGTGELLTPCDPVRELGLHGRALVLVCPHVHVSTAWAYAAFDAWAASRGGAKPEPAKGQDQKQGRGFRGVYPEKASRALTCDPETSIEPSSRTGKGQWQHDGVFWLENSFEPPVFAAYPELGLFKARLLREGAGAVVMSGSGASIFALFRSVKRARSVTDRFRTSGVAAYCHVL